MMNGKSPTPEVIALNVGGRCFACTKETLMNAGPESLLYMLGVQWSSDSDSGHIVPLLRDSRGALFIDRNPDIFEQLLDFLRTGCCHETLLLTLSEQDEQGTLLQRLRAEASYFFVVPLLRVLDNMRVTYLQLHYKSVGIDAMVYCRNEAERQRLQSAGEWPRADRNTYTYIRKDKVLCVLAELGWRVCSRQPVKFTDDYHSVPILMWKYSMKELTDTRAVNVASDIDCMIDEQDIIINDSDPSSSEA